MPDFRPFLSDRAAANSVVMITAKRLEQAGPEDMQSRRADGELSPQETIQPETAEAVTAESHSYEQILESSILIGGSTGLGIIIRIVRTKALALLLGPAGYGLFGIYQSITNLAQSAAGMGISGSGVRQIAAAVGTGDGQNVAITSAVLRRTAIGLGLIGAILVVGLSREISILTFSNEAQAGAISLLSIAVLFQLVSDGQVALIQGMRQVMDLAKIGILGTLYGTVISVILVCLFREKGIVPSLVAATAMTLVTSWWYSGKIQVQPVSVSLSQLAQEVGALLKLGSAFMGSAFMIMGLAYAVRIILIRKVDLEAAGIYQAAWTLGGLYAGFILQAMGADFYPRLTAVSHDNAICNRLVNEQTRVGLLLAGPGMLATLTLAPSVINLFYSAQFSAAVGVLRWICLGTALQVVQWPIGFIAIAKGKQVIFFLSEAAWATVSIALAWFCVGRFGVDGAGMAFFGSYLFYVFLVYAIARRLSGFRWSAENVQNGLFMFPLILVVFSSTYVLPARWQLVLGMLSTLAIGVYSIRVLAVLTSWSKIPSPIRRLLRPFRATRSEC